MREAYLTTAGRIRHELDEIQSVAQRVDRIWSVGRASKDEYYADAAALNLHSIYAGLERLFELVARQIDRSVPEGPTWHLDLLEQMAAAVPNVRPAVLTSDVRARLDPLRGFRHVVRNVYAFRLDEDQIGTLVERLPGIVADVGSGLENFAAWLEAVAMDE